VPPKTPAELLQVIRKAFGDTFADPEFRAEAERVLQFRPLTFVGEEAERVNAAVFRAATGPTRDIVKKMAQE
jgi:hypothetical protein